MDTSIMGKQAEALPWIPVADELPEPYELVLIWNGYASFAWQTPEGKWDSDLHEPIFEVTHWLHLMGPQEAQNESNGDKTEALQKISEWANEAYATYIFPEVSSEDMKRAHEILENAGICLSAIHGGWARHLLGGIGRIAREALDNEKSPG